MRSSRSASRISEAISEGEAEARILGSRFESGIFWNQGEPTKEIS